MQGACLSLGSHGRREHLAETTDMTGVFVVTES
jgi:hypothetical protein